jgi:hypothetical protein
MAWHLRGGRHKAKWTVIGGGGYGKNRYLEYRCFCGKTKKEYPERI